MFDTTLGPDLTPPTVASVSPVNGATAVSATTYVVAMFSEAIDPATINGNTPAAAVQFIKDVISKPFDLNDLLDRVRVLCPADAGGQN